MQEVGELLRGIGYLYDWASVEGFRGVHGCGCGLVCEES